MKEIIIVHGKPKRERYENPDIPKPHEANWLPWLQSHLAMWGIKASIPAMPSPYFPVYEDWRSEFEKYVPTGELGLVGHSAGAEFILRWLSENPNVRLTNLALVAPWRDDKQKYGNFSEYILDTAIPERVEGLTTIYSSTDDTEEIRANAARLARELAGAGHHQFSSKGHFMIGDKMTTEEFYPLLSELTLSLNL